MGDIKSYADYLSRVRIPVRPSCSTESGWPFVLSLWFLYRDGLIYCATKEDARIVRYLMNEPRCGYEIAGDLPPYCGVRGQARARIEPELGLETLKELLIRYLNGIENPLATQLLSQADREVAIILEPINCFRWDFSERMESVVTDMLGLTGKECP